MPTGFAGELVGGIVAGYVDMRMNPPEALSFVLHDVEYDGDFLVALTRAVVEHELAWATDDPGPEHLPWPFVTWSSRLVATLGTEVDETGSSPIQRAGDPLYALMEALSRDGNQRVRSSPIRSSPATCSPSVDSTSTGSPGWPRPPSRPPPGPMSCPTPRPRC